MVYDGLVDLSVELHRRSPFSGVHEAFPPCCLVDYGIHLAMALAA